MDTQKTFHICVLLYGNHAHLAERCLRSIVRRYWANRTVDVRVGFNDACGATYHIASEVAYSYPRWWGIRAPHNVGKYPLMRRMFYDRPLTGSHVIWFDDDSYWDYEDWPKWWMRLLHALDEHDVIGSLYKLSTPVFNQRFKAGWPGIREQPWFTGKKPPTREGLAFPTGGWWVTRTEILQKHDWPPVELHHNGGDTLFGELCRQQGYKIGQFNTGVRINADAEGRESRGDRRGLSKTSPPPFHGCGPGTDYLAYRAECIQKYHAFHCEHFPLSRGDLEAWTTNSIIST